MIRRTILPNLPLLIVGALVVIAVAVLLLKPSPSAPEAPSSQPVTTIDPHIIANLTALPKATPLSGQEANDMNGLRQMVDSCGDYTEERRGQMDEQIDFVINPAGLPPDVVLVLGDNPRLALLTALARVTLNQWQLIHQPAGSCLIPIGKRLNQIIGAAGGTPVAGFEGG